MLLPYYIARALFTSSFFKVFLSNSTDTHGIVYTPQPIVDFMVKSVEQILKTEFDRSLSDSGVHIIDPFVGTGNFIVRIMREIRRTALQGKYKTELHCNEVMLLPYYIASMNIEHEFYEATNTYRPFEGLCLVDTFELATSPVASWSAKSAVWSSRVDGQQMALFFGNTTAKDPCREYRKSWIKPCEQQKKTEMFVVFDLTEGEPPDRQSALQYGTGQYGTGQ